MTAEKKPSMKKLFGAVLATLLIATLAACPKKEEKAKAEEPETKPVRFGVVTQEDIERELTLVCNIMPNRRAVLMSNVPGVITTIHHREGEVVSEGDPLIDVNPEEVEVGIQQAQAALSQAYAVEAQANVQATLARTEYERFSALLDSEAISQSDFDRVQAQYDAALEAVKMAEAGVENAKALIDKAEIYQRDTVIAAPFGGEIAKLLVEEGERIMTMPPTALMALMDYDTVKVQCPVAERDVGSISNGTNVTVFVDAFPNASSEATIDRVIPFLDAESRTFTVEIHMDNYDHKYKPGMMARVFVKAVYPTIISVHRDAFSLNNITGDIRVVEIVDGVAKERKAIPGRSFGPRMEILDLAGLHVGSIVITSGASDIQEGDKVEIVDEQPTDGTELLPDGAATVEEDIWEESPTPDVETPPATTAGEDLDFEYSTTTGELNTGGGEEPGPEADSEPTTMDEFLEGSDNGGADGGDTDVDAGVEDSGTTGDADLTGEDNMQEYDFGDDDNQEDAE